MKRFSLVAAAALLVAGTQLHAQATKQDTAKKSTKAAATQQAGAAKTESKAAVKPATKSAMKVLASCRLSSFAAPTLRRQVASRSEAWNWT